MIPLSDLRHQCANRILFGCVPFTYWAHNVHSLTLQILCDQRLCDQSVYRVCYCTNPICYSTNPVCHSTNPVCYSTSPLCYSTCKSCLLFYRSETGSMQKGRAVYKTLYRLGAECAICLLCTVILWPGL